MSSPESTLAKTPLTPLEPLVFARGGMVKKRFRRKAIITQANSENQPNGTTNSIQTTDNSNNNNDHPQQWWSDKRDHFLHWLRCNPLRLGISADSVTFIKDQLKRGDEKKDRRSTCWRHVVVELLSLGVPGLDDELLSIAEIPKAKYDDINMNDLLDAPPSVLQGTAATTTTVLSLEEISIETLRTEIVRLGKERLLLRTTLQEKDDMATAATEKEATARQACVLAQGALTSGLELQTSQANRIQELTKEMKELKKQIANGPPSTTTCTEDSNIAGSGIAAVKALSARPSSAGETVASVDISSMTMLERQQHFSNLRTKKRDDAMAKKKQEEEEEMKRGADERKAAAARRNSNWNHVRSRLHDVVETGAGKKKSQVGLEKEKKTDSSNSSSHSSGNGSGWGKLRNMKAEGKLKFKKKKGKKTKSSKSTKASSGSSGAPSLLDMCNAMLKKKPIVAAIDASTLIDSVPSTSTTTDEPPPTPTPQHSPSQSRIGLQPPQPNQVMATTTEEETMSIAIEKEINEIVQDKAKKEEEEMEEPFSSKGFFSDFGSNDIKGKHVIQDAMPFNIDTFYRRRDKHSGRDGVSLLMARKDDDHGTQEAIAVFFARDKFTEEDACEWWMMNKIRFPVTYPIEGDTFN